jgi:site-specific DNA recombinase
MRAALREGHADEKREHEAAIARLKAEYDRLQNRIYAMYVDKLDGRVDTAFFERMSAEWRAEQDRCLREIERHQSADQSYMVEGVRLLELARNAQRLFQKQEPREKRRLLNFLVSNCSWKGGELTSTLRQPFDSLAQAAAAQRRRRRTGDRNRRKERVGWGTWIRTRTARSRAESSTVKLSPKATRRGIGGGLRPVKQAGRCKAR